MKVLPFTSRIVLAGLVAVAGTGTVAAQEEYEDYAIEPIEADPWEPVNRAVFSFNDTVDRYTLKPIAKAYDWAVPEPVSKSISNVFNNLGEPRNLVNDTLQGKFHAAGIDTARFLLNSTVGVLGVFDVATKMGLQRNDEDFGQTLGACAMVARGFRKATLLIGTPNRSIMYQPAILRLVLIWSIREPVCCPVRS